MRRLLVILMVLGLVGAACGDDGASDLADPDDDDTTEPEPEGDDTTEPEPEGDDTTEPEPATLPESISAVLDSTYTFAGVPLEPGQLPFEAGDITARWFVDGDRYVVFYDGLDPATPTCPGNSIQLDTGFAHISNAPLAGLDCLGDTVIENTPDQGVVACGPQVWYRTLIPADLTGTLYGSVEIFGGDIDGVGATSTVATAPGTAAEIDLSAHCG